MKYDFSGYATKNNLKCSDGRTIQHGAFKDMDGKTVPLVWQHLHNDPANVLGHAILENRKDGTYAYCSFNDTPAGQNAKQLVMHKDVNALSIYANQLVQRGGDVVHGVIREVSLVLSGANPGALIDNLSFAHGDSYDTVEDEAIIYTGLALQHADKPSLDSVTPTEPAGEEIAHADNSTTTKEAPMAEKTVQDVFDSMTEEQKNVVYFLIGQAIEDQQGGGAPAMAQSAFDDDDEDDYIQHEDYEMRNVFMNGYEAENTPTLSHGEIQTIMQDGPRFGSLKESFLAHAGTYGIDNIDILFPDAKAIANTPQFIQRRTEWVSKVLSGTTHSPFSRIKTMVADITADEARARGYVKGNRKKEEVFGLLKRDVTPTTIYKKQKIDRDDLIDITDLNVIAWLKAEMRLMLDEELARAILVGDGRDVASEDKIDETKIKPIYKDDEMYAHRLTVTATANPEADVETTIDAIIRSRSVYRGTGTPTMFATTEFVADMLLAKDKMGRRHYSTSNDLASALRVSEIVEVPILEGMSRVDATTNKTLSLMAIIVNLKDYTVGADKGGEVSMFDDFDIDFNQQKYLIETRCSGMLTVPKSAIIVEQAPAA